MGSVTPIRKEPEYIAHCPKCRSTFWLIRLGNINDDWKNVIGTECVNCGFFINWVRANRKDKN